MADRLNPGASLNHGEHLGSANGRYVLKMQEDGNVVIRMTGNLPIWSSGTAGNPGSILKMQDDGNLVVIAPGNVPIWHTGTGIPRSILFVKDDGNALVIAPGTNVVWHAGCSIPDYFWDPVTIQMSPETRDKLDQTWGGFEGGVVCTVPGPNVLVCVVAMILAAVIVELATGNPPFGPHNDIRVIGGQIVDGAKEAGRQLSDWSKSTGGKISDWHKEAGGKISDTFKKWFH